MSQIAHAVSFQERRTSWRDFSGNECRVNTVVVRVAPAAGVDCRCHLLGVFLGLGQESQLFSLPLQLALEICLLLLLHLDLKVDCRPLVFVVTLLNFMYCLLCSETFLHRKHRLVKFDAFTLQLIPAFGLLLRIACLLLHLIRRDAAVLDFKLQPLMLFNCCQNATLNCIVSLVVLLLQLK